MAVTANCIYSFLGFNYSYTNDGHYKSLLEKLTGLANAALLILLILASFKI
jgi:hypothetical protein